MYILYYICLESTQSNPTLLVPDSYGSRLPPKLVVRQYMDRFQLLQLGLEPGMEEIKLWDVTKNSDEWVLLRCFKEQICQYMFEPGSLLIGPRMDTNYPTFTALSPNPVRYKEFAKAFTCAKFYMPTYNLEELLRVGANYRQKLVDTGVDLSFWSDEKIKERYASFGGIIRRVVSKDQLVLKDFNFARTEAIEKLTPHMAMSLMNTQDLSGFPSYLVTWGPEVDASGKYVFRSRATEFASEEVKQSLIEKVGQLTFESKQKYLRDLCKVDSTIPLIRYLCEDLVSLFLSRGMVPEYKLKKGIVVKHIVPFRQMKANVIYSAVIDQQFPAFDTCLKYKNNLVCVSVVTGVNYKKCTNGALTDFTKRLELSVDDINNATVIVWSVAQSGSLKWSISTTNYTKPNMIELVNTYAKEIQAWERKLPDVIRVAFTPEFDKAVFGKYCIIVSSLTFLVYPPNKDGGFAISDMNDVEVPNGPLV